MKTTVLRNALRFLFYVTVGLLSVNGYAAPLGAILLYFLVGWWSVRQWYFRADPPLLRSESEDDLLIGGLLVIEWPLLYLLAAWTGTLPEALSELVPRKKGPF